MTFQFFVRIINGSGYKTITILATNDELIDNIISKIEAKVNGLCFANILLRYASSFLQPDKSVGFYNIKSGSTLECHFRVQNNISHIKQKDTDLNNKLNVLSNKYKAQLSDTHNIHDLSHKWNQIQPQIQKKYKSVCELKSKNLANFNKQRNIKLEYLKKRKQMLINHYQLKTKQNKKEYQQYDIKIETHKRIIKKLKIEKTKQYTHSFNKCQQIQSNIDKISGEEQKWMKEVNINTTDATDDTIDLLDRLRKQCRNELDKHEDDCDQWNVDNVISWLTLIENQYFNYDKYDKCMKMIKNDLKITGSKLKELGNDSLLKVIGFNLIDRKIILKHIDRLINDKDTGNKLLCMGCVINKINTVFIPCGHQSYCYQCCGRRVVHRCPICRKKVSKTVRTFMTGF